MHHRPPLFALFDQNTTLGSSRPFATVSGKYMNSFLNTFSFVSFFSWTGPQTNIAKQQDKNLKAECRLSQQYRPRAFYYPHLINLQLNSSLGGGKGSYFLLATCATNDNHPSRWTICSKGWNKGSADMHMPAKSWQLSRQVIYGGGFFHRQVVSGHHENPYLNVDTIIYHKENKNNALKSWPLRLVE